MQSNKKYYLFSKFPVDPNIFSKLPMVIIPGVCLDYTPKRELNFAHGKNASKKENIAWAGLVYPGFGLNIGMCHFCITIDHTIPDAEKDALFWFVVASLFITKPLFINVTGAFYSGNEDSGFVENPEGINLRSNLSLEGMTQKLEVAYKEFFDESDIECARLLLERMLYIRKYQCTMPRVNYNLNIFFQAVCWEKLHYEVSIFSKLFAFMDSFACNPSHNHEENVSERIAKFLFNLQIGSEQICKDSIKARHKYVWSLHRYPDVHGHVKPPAPTLITTPSGAFDFDSAKDLYSLFEMARLCLYKLLLLPIDNLQEYSAIPTPPLGFISKEDNNKRDLAAKAFFGKSYNNPTALRVFFDFSNPKEIKPKT